MVLLRRDSMGRRREYATATERQRAHRAEVRTELLATIPQVHGEGYTLYQGEARAVLPLLTGLDVLITDPPYGVNLGATKGTGGKHGLKRAGYTTYDDTPENFCRVVVPLVRRSLRKVIRGAVFTGPHVWEMPKAADIGRVHTPEATGRGPWGYNVDQNVLFYGTAP